MTYYSTKFMICQEEEFKMPDRKTKEYVTELLEQFGYAETVVTLMYENENLDQYDAEAIVDEVVYELDLDTE